MRRHRAPVGEAREAVIALAGGPGQAAIPFTEDFAQLLGPVLSTRDLIVFDQRGIGLSGALSCHRLRTRRRRTWWSGRSPNCAGELGPSRSYYTTAQTRRGHRGDPRGGRLRKARAVRHLLRHQGGLALRPDLPDQVEALVLDSVVHPTGPNSWSARRSPRSRACCTSCAPRGMRADHAPTGRGPRTVVARIGAGALRGRDRRAGHARTRSHRRRGPARDPGWTATSNRSCAPNSRPPWRGRHGDTAPLARSCMARTEAGGQEEVRRRIRPAALLRDDLRRAALPWNRASSPEARCAKHARSGRAARAASAPFAPPTCSCSATCRPAPTGPSRPPPRSRRGAAPERADADPERRRRSAHADRQRPRGGRPDPGAHLLVVPTSATRCSAPTSAAARAKPAGVLRAHPDPALPTARQLPTCGRRRSRPHSLAAVTAARGPTAAPAARSGGGANAQRTSTAATARAARARQRAAPRSSARCASAGCAPAGPRRQGTKVTSTATPTCRA